VIEFNGTLSDRVDTGPSESGQINDEDRSKPSQSPSRSVISDADNTSTLSRGGGIPTGSVISDADNTSTLSRGGGILTRSVISDADVLSTPSGFVVLYSGLPEEVDTGPDKSVNEVTSLDGGLIDVESFAKRTAWIWLRLTAIFGSGIFWPV